MRIKRMSTLLGLSALAVSVTVRADQRLDDIHRLNLDSRVAAKLPAKCIYKVQSYRFFVSDDPCMRLFPLRRLRGIWIVSMENSSFLPGLTQLPSQHQIETTDVWLEAESSSDPRVRKIMADVDGIYAVDMLAHVPPIKGAYGHFGMFKRGVLLERILSIKLLRRGASPPRAATARGG